jgi:hypothetical protein
VADAHRRALGRATPCRRSGCLTPSGGAGLIRAVCAASVEGALPAVVSHEPTLRTAPVDARDDPVRTASQISKNRQNQPQGWAMSATPGVAGHSTHASTTGSLNTPGRDHQHAVPAGIEFLYPTGSHGRVDAGHYRVLREGKLLRKPNGMPFTLPFSRRHDPLAQHGEMPKPPTSWSSASTAIRSYRLSELSRSRSRVRVLSLPLLVVPANRGKLDPTGLAARPQHEHGRAAKQTGATG